jgi:hypothetical protein
MFPTRSSCTTAPNSPFRESVVNDDVRCIERREWNDSRPAALGKQDFENIMKSGNLFARKVDVEKDAEILAMIAASLED